MPHSLKYHNLILIIENRSKENPQNLRWHVRIIFKYYFKSFWMEVRQTGSATHN